VGSFPLKLYLYEEFLILKSATASHGNVVALSEQNVCQALYFRNSLFRIEQFTMLFAVQEVLY